MHKEEWWGKVGVDWLMRELVLKVFICWFWFENTVYKRRKRKKRKKNNVMKWGGRGVGLYWDELSHCIIMH